MIATIASIIALITGTVITVVAYFDQGRIAQYRKKICTVGLVITIIAGIVSIVVSNHETDTLLRENASMHDQLSDLRTQISWQNTTVVVTATRDNHFLNITNLHPVVSMMIIPNTPQALGNGTYHDINLLLRHLPPSRPNVFWYTLPEQETFKLYTQQMTTQGNNSDFDFAAELKKNVILLTFQSQNSLFKNIWAQDYSLIPSTDSLTMGTGPYSSLYSLNNCFILLRIDSDKPTQIESARIVFQSPVNKGFIGDGLDPITNQNHVPIPVTTRFLGFYIPPNTYN